MRLTISDEGCSAQGGHVGRPTPLADVLQPTDGEHFLLHGRTADLVNIAGKRNSLGYLNHQLNAIPGVIDGAFFVREDSHVIHLPAVAAWPRWWWRRAWMPSAIIQALRARIDPVFLPRPLLLVEHLPRNETGKLPQHTLARDGRAGGSAAAASVRMNRQRVSLRIAADHPALAGHFPGFPIVPGVVLLDEALHAIEQALATEALPWHIGNVKFHHVVRAGEQLLLDFESQADQRCTSNCAPLRFSWPAAP